MTEHQRLDRLFEIMLYLVVLLPFFMLALGAGVGPVTGLLFLAFLAGSVVAHHRGFARKERVRTFNTLIIAVIFLSFADWFFLESSVLDIAIRLVLVLTLIKFYSRINERDELQIFVLGFLVLATATTVNEDLTWGILFGIWVLVATFGLAIFHLRSELGARSSLALLYVRTLDRQYTFALIAIGVAVLIGSVGIFFAFPRVGLGFFVKQSRDGVSVTGFSESVELGNHGNIRDNPEVVMRVEFIDGDRLDLQQTIRWRTMAFDHYDGRRWSRQIADRDERPLPRRRDQVHDLSSLYQGIGEPRATLQIYLEPLGTNVIPTIWPTGSIGLGTSGFPANWSPRSGHLNADVYSDIRHTIESQLGIPYVLVVHEEPPIRDSPSATDAELRQLQAYLQLPQFSERFLRLARDITGEASGRVQKANAIHAFFQSDFQYSTQMPVVGDNPVESFVFDARSGHCEYFATSMVMLLRAAGIPARLVNGFLGGEYNTIGNYLAVRQGDAHSWVEYYLPGTGWVPIDPTPPADLLAQTASFSRIRQYWDAARLVWLKWVIEYDLAAQVEVLRNLSRRFSSGGGPAAGQADGASDDEASGTTLPRSLLVGVLFFMASYLLARRRFSQRRVKVAIWIVGVAGAAGLYFVFTGDTSPQDMALLMLPAAAGFALGFRRHEEPWMVATAAFERVEAAARKNGVTRPEDMGPAEFLWQLKSQSPDAGDLIARFEKFYLAARFGNMDTGEENLALLAKHVARKLTKKRSARVEPKE